MAKTSFKNQHLISIATLLPLLAGGILVTQYDVALSPTAVALICSFYLLSNVIYGVIRKTFELHMIVEFSLIAMIAFFALTSNI
jgi:hypothetical protein